MSKKRQEKIERTAHRRIAKTLEEIATFDVVCSGTIHVRKKKCGTATCGCHKDPEAMHGPYYEWSWLEGKKLRHKTLSAEQAALVQEAIDSHRSVLELLKQWEQHSLDLLFDGENPKAQPAPRRTSRKTDR
jgi:hypothetical protein